MLFDNFGSDVTDPKYVARHSFFPLIHFRRMTRRYNRSARKHELKHRDIYIASHKDAHIFSYYAFKLLDRYEQYLENQPYDTAVLAYRALGKDNVDFALEAFADIESRGECVALCIDLSKFFDTLNHQLLKKHVSNVLGVGILPDDWFKVFSRATKFSFVERENLDVVFKSTVVGTKRSVPYCSPAEFRNLVRKSGGVLQQPTPGEGVAQGLPISSVLSNVYMIEFDRALHAACGELGATYRRYSDDILILCSQNQIEEIQRIVALEAANAKVRIHPTKTDIVHFAKGAKFLRADKPLQYLGLTFDGKRRLVRSASISRFAHRIHRSATDRKLLAKKSIWRGGTPRLFKKSLLDRLSHLAPDQSFYGYIRKVSRKSGTNQAKRQVRRYWQILHDELRE